MLASASERGTIAPGRAIRRPSIYLEALRGVRADPFAVVAFFVLLTFCVTALAGSSLAPYDPLQQSLATRLQPPSWQTGGSLGHPFGTDQLGRDVLSRMMVGAKVSAIVGLAVVILGAVVGTTLGLCAGFFGGRVETIITTVVDIVISFPGILLALTIATVLGPSVGTLIVALSLRGWVVYARVARGQTLALSRYQYIEAARAIGVSSPRILAGHLLPNLFPAIMTIAVLEMARMVLAESSLSFIGVGIQPPDISWGLMLAEGRNYMLTANWLVTLPGVAIALTVLSVNILASHVRRVLDPFQRGRVENTVG